tara:strand:- start:2038 stop:2637 length:600 start_codon:yes stop_codon:yes gene_type:complete
MGGFIMDWKLILRIAVIIALMFLLASSFAGCKKNNDLTIDWETCSQYIGDHPCDFKLIDQNGKEFNLYDHHGKIIIVDFSAMWCLPCGRAAMEVEELQKKYNNEIVYITILIENSIYEPPSVADLQKWSKAFGIESAPVLAASRDMISTDPDIGWPLFAWPQFYIIGKDLVLLESFKGFSPGRMEEVILNRLSQDTGSP